MTVKLIDGKKLAEIHLIQGDFEDVKDRKCFFKECLAYYDGKDITYFYGVSEGTLSFEVKGMDSFKKWSDLWYIFKPRGFEKTLAEKERGV
mgnify:CR=1 FL=1